MDTIPTEVFVKILMGLSVFDRIRLTRVSKKFKAVIEDPRNENKCTIGLVITADSRGDYALATTEQPKKYRVNFRNGKVEFCRGAFAFFGSYKAQSDNSTDDTSRLLDWLFGKFKINLTIRNPPALNTGLKRSLMSVIESKHMAIETVKTVQRCFQEVAAWFPALKARHNCNFIVKMQGDVVRNTILNFNRITSNFRRVMVHSWLPVHLQIARLAVIFLKWQDGVAEFKFYMIFDYVHRLDFADDGLNFLDDHGMTVNHNLWKRMSNKDDFPPEVAVTDPRNGNCLIIKLARETNEIVFSFELILGNF